MNAYEFTLILEHDPTDAEVDALFEPFEGSAVPEGGNGHSVVHVHHSATSLASAIADAMVKVESVGLAVAGVKSEDTVSLRDIARRSGRTYESVRRLTTGQRGPGGFPIPFSTESWALYSWAEVSSWLATHYGIEAASVYDREITAADYLIRARHLLADDPERGDMAQLVTA
jgi:hypothetical protein